ncbi:MAG TPA: hypothetical protein VFT22_44510 [Kofleriaceae bacterium]|nr:hypothetical protein [Kofleriaceae bacterium]
MRTRMAFLLVACLMPRTVHAGRSFYGWLYGTEVMPERGVELQTWVFEENDKYATHVKETSLWWGPLVGVTDQLELSLPIELDWTVSDAQTQASFTVRRFGIEARYRLAPPDSVEASPLVPLVRVAAKRDVSVRDDVRVEADAVMSYEVGALHALIDLGFIGDLNTGNNHTEIRPGGGVSLRVASELRVGAEVYSEIGIEKGSDRWALIGPNLAWTHGRFWISGAFGVGLYHVRTAPRVMWGIAF